MVIQFNAKALGSIPNILEKKSIEYSVLPRLITFSTFSSASLNKGTKHNPPYPWRQSLDTQPRLAWN